MEACITIMDIVVVLLQRHLERPREWALVATWSRCLEAFEQSGSHVLLDPELQALLIDLMQYQPKLLVIECRIAPYKLDMHEELTPALKEWAVDELLLLQAES